MNIHDITVCGPLSCSAVSGEHSQKEHVPRVTGQKCYILRRSTSLASAAMLRARLGVCSEVVASLTRVLPTLVSPLADLRSKPAAHELILEPCKTVESMTQSFKGDVSSVPACFPAWHRCRLLADYHSAHTSGGGKHTSGVASPCQCNRLLELMRWHHSMNAVPGSRATRAEFRALARCDIMLPSVDPPEGRRTTENRVLQPRDDESELSRVDWCMGWSVEAVRTRYQIFVSRQNERCTPHPSSLNFKAQDKTCCWDRGMKRTRLSLRF